MDAINRFGGHWTEKKLAVISKYLSAYTLALKNQPFKKAYIDAFAGCGSSQPQPHGERGERWPMSSW